MGYRMSGRDFALAELDARRLPRWPAKALKRIRLRPPADPRDLALSEQLVVGVVKNLLLLQHHIEHFAGKRLGQIDPLLQKILAIGLYQLEFLDRIPASAAVNEAVAQAKRFGRSRGAGFVNAILRNATRQGPPPLPDEASDPRRFAQIALSHPPELFDKLAQLLGTQEALAFCRHDNCEPPTLVRLFDGVDVGAVQRPEVHLTPHEQRGMFAVTGATRAILADWAANGLAQAQDATAAAVVDQMELTQGQRVLDRCAGRGTKTLQMVQRMGSTGLIVAVDASRSRCRALDQLLDRRGIENVQTYCAAELSGIALRLPGAFDRILVDVPCSNSGVLARRPEARYAQDARRLASLGKLQRQILDDTAAWLAAGGLLLYSTCSIWPEENQEQIEQFLERHQEFALADQCTILPSFPDGNPARYRDGGYVARLGKSPG